MNSQEIKIALYENLGEKVVRSLSERGFEAYYVPSAADAVKKALSYIGKDSVCTWGGSMTIEETGLLAQVKKNFTCIDRDLATSPEERIEFMRKGLSADVLLTSFNAVSQDGTVVNIDGVGNRVAGITFGPKSVIALVGMNKIVPTEQDAIARVRTVAAPKNAIRFGKSPDQADSLCNITQILKSGGKGRIKVILFGEEAGF